jgi:homoserine O-acetyltransferase
MFATRNSHASFLRRLVHRRHLATKPRNAAATQVHRHITSQTQQPFFPCVDAHAARESRIRSGNPFSSASKASSASGPEPPYARPNPTSYHIYHHPSPMTLTYADPLPSFDIAYETWGTLNEAKDNVILLHTGLSASSHAASTAKNLAPGWWEKFIGPGKALDTNQFFVICTNVLGGCYGSTGPSSLDPSTGEAYGTRFPILSVFDMVRAQFLLLDYLGIEKLYASVGSSMGGMQSLAAGWLHPDRVGKIVSISGTARSSPGAIAMRYAQRSVLMADPNWNKGFYYDASPPHTGMKLARQIATITYRSGPEWDQRFGRKWKEQVHSDSEAGSETPKHHTPALCPDFMIEQYLDHQGEQFCLKYDANSLIYISKAMDLFDMTLPALESLNLRPATTTSLAPIANATKQSSHSKSHPPPTNPPAHLPDLAAGLTPLAKIPTLILGVQSDILFTVDQQREVAAALRLAGNDQVSYYELGGVWGHDTFLLDVLNVGGAVRGFLS